MQIYRITVENRETGERDAIWFQRASTEQEALTESDKHLRDLGWPAQWTSVSAEFVGYDEQDDDSYVPLGDGRQSE